MRYIQVLLCLILMACQNQPEKLAAIGHDEAGTLINDLPIAGKRTNNYAFGTSKDTTYIEETGSLTQKSRKSLKDRKTKNKMLVQKSTKRQYAKSDGYKSHNSRKGDYYQKRRYYHDCPYRHYHYNPHRHYDEHAHKHYYSIRSSKYSSRSRRR
jgi:hypothetical protein